MTAITVTAVIGVLAVVVAMLSYRTATRDDSGPSSSQLAALEARVDILAGQLGAAQKSAQTAAADAKVALAAASTAPRPAQPALATCLTQVQREIDDLWAYLAYRTSPHRNRVSGTCRTLLKPRFGQ